MPTTLAPRTPLEESIKDLYNREFTEPIFRPAIFNDTRSVDCLGNGHLTSAAYLRLSATRSRLMFLYTARDGTQLNRRETSPNVITPAGRFRVLVALLEWEDTFSASSLPDWEAAQARINEDHAAFARSKGYTTPIVSFESTNVFIPGSEVSSPNTSNGIAAALAARGIAATAYDFVAAVNLDPSKSEGGLAFVGTTPATLYVGNYGRFRTRLSTAQMYGVASTVYHHEIAHHWGWPGSHDWSSTCGGTRLGFEPLIAAPILFGWEDTDGDGVPEILDPTPYGRSR